MYIVYISKVYIPFATSEEKLNILAWKYFMIYFSELKFDSLNQNDEKQVSYFCYCGSKLFMICPEAFEDNKFLPLCMYVFHTEKKFTL